MHSPYTAARTLNTQIRETMGTDGTVPLTLVNGYARVQDAAGCGVKLRYPVLLDAPGAQANTWPEPGDWIGVQHSDETGRVFIRPIAVTGDMHFADDLYPSATQPVTGPQSCYTQASYREEPYEIMGEVRTELRLVDTLAPYAAVAGKPSSPGGMSNSYYSTIQPLPHPADFYIK